MVQVAEVVHRHIDRYQQYTTGGNNERVYILSLHFIYIYVKKQTMEEKLLHTVP
jgi:hypothetical protein